MPTISHFETGCEYNSNNEVVQYVEITKHNQERGVRTTAQNPSLEVLKLHRNLRMMGAIRRHFFSSTKSQRDLQVHDITAAD